MNKEITHTPNDVGFDYSLFFLLQVIVPCVYVRNRKVVNLDPNDPIGICADECPFDDIVTTTNNTLLRMVRSHGHNKSIVNGIGRIGYMRGGKRLFGRMKIWQKILNELKILLHLIK